MEKKRNHKYQAIIPLIGYSCNSLKNAESVSINDKKWQFMRATIMLCLLFFFSFIIPIQSQTIITAAGTGVGSSSGDGGLFSKATFNRPIHMIYDKAGNLYISELTGKRIRRIDAVSGIITTLISGLFDPRGFAFDRQEQFMYIATYDCVYRLDMSSKQVSVFAGIPGAVCYSSSMCGEGVPALTASFGKCSGVAVDSVGNVFVADENMSRVKKIDIVSRTITTYAGGAGCNCSGYGDGGQANEATLLFPVDVRFDNQGNLIIADAGIQNIRKVDLKTGIITTIAGLSIPSAWGYSGDGGPAVKARLHDPAGIFIDKKNNLYIAEGLNNTIRKVDKAGIITTIAGTGTVAGYSGDCGPAEKALLNAPLHAVVKSDGGILIADFLNNVIREIINSVPNVIVTSSNSLCVNSTLILKNSASGGEWHSSNPDIAKVSSNGVVIAMSQGSVDISYFISNGCNNNSSKVSITVNPIPPVPQIKGISTLCETSTTNLTSTVSGGVWSSSDSSIALPDANGLIKAISSGSAMIKYSLFSDGCSSRDSTKIVVNPSPKLFSIAVDTDICVNSMTSLGNATAGGIWSINNIEIASINSSTGIVYGKSAGKAILSYTLTNGCGSATIHAGLKVNPLPFFSLGDDTSICVNSNLQLQPLINNVSYLWEDGSNIDIHLISKPGLYSLKVIDSNLCSFSDTIHIQTKPLPLLSLGNDTTLCNNIPFTLNTKDASIKNYKWQDGSLLSSYNIKKAGQYNITVTGINGCIDSDTINIYYLNSPVVNLGANRTICPANPVIINPQLSSVTYLWQDGSTQPTFTVTQPGIYSLKATNPCGTGVANVEFKKGLCRLLLPDAFTPNNDGMNDVFRVKYTDFTKTIHLKIFNRWGALIFDTTDPNQGWNGKFKSIDQDSGTFIWMITLTDFQGNTENAKGTVLLIR